MKNRRNRKAAAILLSLFLLMTLIFPCGAVICQAEEPSGESRINISDSGKVLSSAVLDADNIERKIRELIEENADITPSVSIRVFGQNDDICSVTYGMADRENNVAADEETVYEWGSVSKMLVWVSVMQLYEEGSLELDRDIREYLPQGFLKKLSSDEPITMLNLMSHNAGFQEPYKELETNDPEALMPLDKALSETEPAQIYAPGEVTGYSNWGAALAAYVVENVSGMDYADYVKKNIFERLGMEHTSIKPDLSDNPWAADARKKTHCYSISGGELNAMGECRAYIHVYPAGAAAGTADDLKKFAQAFLCDSADTPLFTKSDTLDIMLSPTLYYADGKTPRFCHGLEADIYGSILLGHGGNTTGFTSLLQFDRESRTGFVMMINVRGDTTYRAELPKLIYGETDYSQFKEENFDKADLSGHYIMSGGSFEKGCVSPASLISDRFHIKNENGCYVGNRGISSITQISDNAVIIKLITGKENLYFISTDENGNIIRLENSSIDFIKYSDLRYFIEIALIIAPILSIATMAVFLVIHIIRFRKFKEAEEKIFKLCEIILGITVTALAAALILIGVYGVYNMTLRTVFCTAASIFLVLMLILLVVCFIRRQKGAANKVLILECVCCFFITAGFIYWRIYQFWGF
ncbi:MAG: serine hydrolase domain-containing protein [Oscillospiraceae bacterium]